MTPPTTTAAAASPSWSPITRTSCLPCTATSSTRTTSLFAYATDDAGLASIGRTYVGFGTGFLDVDNDGWQDIVIVNGHVIRYPKGATVRQRPVLFLNQGVGSAGKSIKFVDATRRAGTYFQTTHQGRGLAIGDLDNDGRPDVIVSHVNEPVTVLRNMAPRSHHWIGLTLQTKDHRDIVGARIKVEVGGRVLTRITKGGGSYLSSSDRRVLVGLGDNDKAVRVTVVWPWGQQQRWDNLAVDRYWQLVAGEPGARK